jgi:uncharacterized protein (DUF2249 family)
MAGCSHAQDLQPQPGTADQRPEYIVKAPSDRVVRLDVRPIVAGGSKPCGAINEAIEVLGDGNILHIINSFQPGSLYQRLEGRGYKHWTEREGGDWHIFFFRP